MLFLVDPTTLDVTRQAVTPGGRSDVKDGVADSAGGAARDLLVAQHTEAECVDEGIAFVAFVEIDLAGDGRDAKAIAVMGDAADDARKESAVICDLWFAVCGCGVSAFGGGRLALTPALSPGFPSPIGWERGQG